MNLKWDSLLKKIRGDPEKFLYEEKGWKAFFTDTEELEEEQAESEDSEFQSEEEEEEEDEEIDEDGSDYDSDAELDSLVDEEGSLIRRRVRGIAIK